MPNCPIDEKCQELPYEHSRLNQCGYVCTYFVLSLVQRAVVVAVIAMRVMQVAVDQIVYVISVRHRFVAASGPMHVAWVMTGTAMLRGALVRIGRGDLDDMFIDVVAMDVMEMPIMQIVDMAVMMNGRMPAIRAVNMRMVGMLGVGACRHGMTPRFAQRPVNSRVDRRVASVDYTLIVKGLPAIRALCRLQ